MVLVPGTNDDSKGTGISTSDGPELRLKNDLRGGIAIACLRLSIRRDIPVNDIQRVAQKPASYSSRW